MRLLKKISVKHVVGDKNAIREIANSDDGCEKVIMRVGGTATGYQTGDGDSGVWTKLKGNFKAINTLTGEESRGTNLFTPDEFSCGIVSAIDGGAEGVEFVLDVAVKPSGSVIGYEYVAIPVVLDDAPDPFETLFSAAPDLKVPPPVEVKKVAKKAS